MDGRHGEGRTPTQPLSTVNVLGIRVHNLTMSGALAWIVAQLDSEQHRHVCFVNAHCANVAGDMPEYLQLLNEADLVLADGSGLQMAGRVLNRPISENINGTDMFPLLMAALSGSSKRVFFFGARSGLTEQTRDWVGTHFPGTRICGTHHGYFTPHEEPDVIRTIRDSRADLLLVGFGVPQQEYWIRDHLEETGARVGIGVGGLFDFYSGRIPRAPEWMRRNGIEWVYRLIQEPTRLWHRYLVGNSRFLYRLTQQRFREGKRTDIRESGDV